MKLFTIHDNATDSYSAPVTIPSQRDAIEALRASVNNPDTAHHKHSPDFTLYEIGSFDQFKGTLSISDKKLVVNASALRNLGGEIDNGTTESV